MNFVIDLMGNILFFIVCLGVTIAMVLFFVLCCVVITDLIMDAYYKLKKKIDNHGDLNI